MKIAVTSQNRKTITEHAGKCRKFWVYEVIGQQIHSKQLIELPIDQSFHEHDHHHDDAEALAARAKPAFIASGVIGKFDLHTIGSRPRTKP